MAGMNYGTAHRGELAPFVGRVFIVAGVAILSFFLWKVREALLLAFASVIVATILLAASQPLRPRTKLSHRWSVALAGIAILLVLVLVGFFIGSQVRSQAMQLLGQVPQGLQSFEETFGLGRATSVPSDGSATQGGGNIVQEIAQNSASLGWVRSLASYGMTAFSVIASIILVVIGGFFLAMSPSEYRKGLVKLFPKGEHARIDDALVVSGTALREWLMAKLIAMAIVGLLAGLGTWWIGLPTPLALGVFAGLTEFVAIIGPIVGAIPAVLLAFSEGGSAVLWTVALFLAIQQLESNVITPVLIRHAVEVPPALLLFAVIAFGVLFGILGFIIAGPLTVVAYVLVKKVWVRQTLGEETSVPGEDHTQQQHG